MRKRKNLHYSLHPKPTSAFHVRYRKLVLPLIAAVVTVSAGGVYALSSVNEQPIISVKGTIDSAKDESQSTSTAAKTSATSTTSSVDQSAVSPDSQVTNTAKSVVSQVSPQTGPTAQPKPAPIGKALFIDSYHNPAAQQAEDWRKTRPNDAAKMDKLAQTAKAAWFGDWTPDVQNAVSDYTSRAATANALPMLVAYNIPLRHCNSGGAASAASYRAWVDGFAAGIGGRPALVVVEPDALGLVTCLSAEKQAERYALVSYAATKFSNAGATVYLDASHWVNQDDMAVRLQKGGVANVTGFAINVANFNPSAEMKAYGDILSTKLGGKHYVIDTSRNGAGGNGEWCNPLGRKVGESSRLIQQGALDGYLWLKHPGESDGTCNGGPDAGQWWAEYALGLAS